MLRTMSLRTVPKIRSTMRVHSLIYTRTTPLSHRRRNRHVRESQCQALIPRTNPDARHCFQRLESTNIPVPTDLSITQHGSAHLQSDGETRRI
jgi:hypothetical protein